MPQEFDPLKFGATPVEDFDPTKFGAVAVTDEPKKPSEPIHLPGSYEWLKQQVKGGKEIIQAALPSWRTAGHVVGATLGGAVGTPLGPAGMATGAVAGASTAESLMQLGEHAIGEGPKTSEESMGKHTDALLVGVGEAAPVLAEAHAQNASAYIRKFLGEIRSNSKTLMTRALNPSDKMFQKHVEVGLDELRAAEKTIGEIADIPKAKRGLEVRSRIYNKQIADEVVKPQATIVVPGSAKVMVDREIAAIPDNIRLTDPDKYTKLVQKIHESHTHDYTIGELNTLRSELAATQSAYYGKDVSGQLTMDAGVRATDIARGQASREQFYSGLDKYGLGGGEAAARLNSRIGSMIHYQDALQDSLNSSVAEQRNLIERAAYKVNRLIRPVSSAIGDTRTVNQNLALAIRRHTGSPQDVKITLEPRIKGITGEQPDLFPIQNRPTPKPVEEPVPIQYDYSNQRPLLDQPEQTSKGIGESGYQAQLDASMGKARQLLEDLKLPITPENLELARIQVTTKGVEGSNAGIRAPKTEAPRDADGSLIMAGGPDSWYARQQASERAASIWNAGATKPKPQSLLSGAPLETETFSPKGEFLSPEDEYLQLLEQRKVWSSNAPKPKPGQQPLLQGTGLEKKDFKAGIKRPKGQAEMFGLKAPEGRLPSSSNKLNYISKYKDGTRLYHYTDLTTGETFESRLPLPPSRISVRSDEIRR